MSKQSQIEQELEASEPWRRAKQFIAKPYGVRDMLRNLNGFSGRTVT